MGLLAVMCAPFNPPAGENTFVRIAAVNRKHDQDDLFILQQIRKSAGRFLRGTAGNRAGKERWQDGQDAQDKTR